MGVTQRTIRHYHQVGLLEEPDRDVSGYRRYGSKDAVRLIRIRGLAAAGVPLARIGELLEAGSEEFHSAMAEVDQLLADRIAELQRHRQRLSTLSNPDADVLPPVAFELMEVLADLGMSEDFLRVEREAAVLMCALYPGPSQQWLRWQVDLLGVEEVRELYRLSNEAVDWDVDDPRIEDLARRSVELTRTHFRRTSDDTQGWWGELDSVSYTLIDQHGADHSPAWRRLTERVAELLLEAGYPVPHVSPEIL